MAANPNNFDYFRRGQVCIVLKAKVDNRTFDYYRRLQPYIGEVLVGSTRVRDLLKSGGVIPMAR